MINPGARYRLSIIRPGTPPAGIFHGMSLAPKGVAARVIYVTLTIVTTFAKCHGIEKNAFKWKYLKNNAATLVNRHRSTK